MLLHRTRAQRLINDTRESAVVFPISRKAERLSAKGREIRRPTAAVTGGLFIGLSPSYAATTGTVLNLTHQLDPDGFSGGLTRNRWEEPVDQTGVH